MQQLTDQESRTWGMICHISAFAGILVPALGHIGGPLISWLMKKDQSAFVDRCGREALNFQLSMLIYMIVSGLLCFILIGWVFVAAIAILNIVLPILAGIAANEGREYKYPLAIKFL